MILLSAIRNGFRGIAASIAYPLAEAAEKRAVRPKVKWIHDEIDRSAAERCERAMRRLVEMVEFAGQHVPYYRDLFASISFDVDKLRADPAYFNDIPYLTKDIIREQGDRLLRQDREGLRVHANKTGGSTGTSAYVFYDQEAADWSSAVNRESRRRIGNAEWRSELHFASKFPETFPWRDRMREAVKCLAMNRYNVFFSSFDTVELESIWRQIKSARPHLVHGHPSTMEQLALYVQRTYGPQRTFAVFESSGELLDPQQRETIRTAFNCDVIDRYGLAEAGVVAYQIFPAQSAMRFYEFFAWPEIRSDSDIDLVPTTPDGSVGELVITPLMNRMMPMLRYRTGDWAELAQTEEGFMVPRMMGRVHDVVTIGGRRLPTHYIQDVLDRVGGIEQFQLEASGNKLLLRVVPELNADIAAISQRVAEWWGDEVVVEAVGTGDLKLVGHRQKFRHLVNA